MCTKFWFSTSSIPKLSFSTGKPLILVPGLKLLEYNSLPLLQGDVAKRPKFKFNERREHEKTIWCSFSELRYSLSEFYSRKICQYLTNWTRQIMSKEVWSSTNSLLCHIFAIAVLVDAEAPSYKQLLELWDGWGRFTRSVYCELNNIPIQHFFSGTAWMHRWYGRKHMEQLPHHK